MSRQAESDQPHAKKFAPSKEVAEKMQPIARQAFHDLLRRAANPPSQQRASKKRTLVERVCSIVDRAILRKSNAKVENSRSVEKVAKTA
jgi:hypothetical protein